MFGWLVALLMGVTTPCAYEDGPAPCYWDGGPYGDTEAYVLILEDA